MQFNELLAALQSDTRADLQTLLQEYRRSLEGSGARGFNGSLRYWEPAYRDASIANDASLGRGRATCRGCCAARRRHSPR